MWKDFKWWLRKTFCKVYHESPVHEWFGLTYSSYAVMQRTAMEQMPIKWQERFVKLMEEVEETLDLSDYPDEFQVNAINPETKKFIRDPLKEYRHPIVIPKKKVKYP